jgi:hypothetical protein
MTASAPLVKKKTKRKKEKEKGRARELLWAPLAAGVGPVRCARGAVLLGQTRHVRSGGLYLFFFLFFLFLFPVLVLGL